MTLRIVVRSSERTYEVVCRPEEFPVSIGRDASCQIQLDDCLVSRHHLWLHVEPEGLRVEDVSSNGTLVHGQPVKGRSTSIAYRDPIQLGRHSVSVERVEGDQPAGFAITPPPRAALPARVLPLRATGDARGTSPTIAPAAEKPASDDKPIVTADAALRREIHRRVLEHLDLAALDSKRLDDPSFRPRVLTALRRTMQALEDQLPPGLDRDRLVGEMADEALGLGPLEQLLTDDEVREIMVIDAQTIYVERRGRIVRSPQRFTDDDRVRAVIERIVTPLGRRIDESSPLVDARLPDGSRVNAIIRPLALKGSCITIRKFPKLPLDIERLYELSALTPAMGQFLTRSVVAKKNIVISGGTGSGKTTLLNVLSAFIPAGERIVTIEDSAELQLQQPHVVRLETRPPNIEGKGMITQRDLVRNALRMRPDRIVIGEVRGDEVIDMLQAMNTGHDGSMSTIHSNGPRDALHRLENLVLMAGHNLPDKAIREQVASAIELVFHVSRCADGRRRIMSVSEIMGMEGNVVTMQEIFRFVATGRDKEGMITGYFESTGLVPRCADRIRQAGVELPSEIFERGRKAA